MRVTSEMRSQHQRRALAQKPMTTTLSPRQLQIAELLQQGKKIQEVSEIIGVKPHTIRQYLHLAYKKLGVRNITELTKRINAGLEDLKAHQIPKSHPDRYKLMTRLRWRDGDNCCVCGEIIDFRIKKKNDPNKPSFFYECRGTIESQLKLAHGKCNPLIGAGLDVDGPGGKPETIYVNEQSE